MEWFSIPYFIIADASWGSKINKQINKQTNIKVPEYLVHHFAGKTLIMLFMISVVSPVAVPLIFFGDKLSVSVFCITPILFPNLASVILHQQFLKQGI